MSKQSSVPEGARIVTRKYCTSDLVHDRMLELIVSGSLTSGRDLRDHEWAEVVEVSRTPIREAIKRLEGLGIVDIAAARYTRLMTFERDLARQEAADWAMVHLMLVQSVVASNPRTLISKLETAQARHLRAEDDKRRACSFAFFEHLRAAASSFSLRLGATSAAYRFRLASNELRDHSGADSTLHAEIVEALRSSSAEGLGDAFANWTRAVTQS